MEFECITFIVVKYQKEDVLIWIYICLLYTSDAADD